MMKRFERILNGLSVTCGVIGGVAMALMMLQISLDVSLKYILNFPIPATLETVSSYYMVAIVFLPLGIVTRDHGHICVELFTQGLRPRRLAAVNAVAGVLSILYVAAIIYPTFGEAIRATQIGETWETALWDMEIWPARWLVPIGCILMLLYFTVNTVDEICLSINGKRILANRY